MSLREGGENAGDNSRESRGVNFNNRLNKQQEHEKKRAITVKSIDTQNLEMAKNPAELGHAKSPSINSMYSSPQKRSGIQTPSKPM